MVFQIRGGRFSATNVTLRMLIRNAYQLQDSQISGGPDWTSADRFDIVAEGDAGLGRVPLMMRALIAEQFKLAVHQENKELPVYALVVARSDRRLGPALSRVDVDCAALAADRERAASRPGPPEPVWQARCGMAIESGSIVLSGGTLLQVANSLSNAVGRTVVDRTGLTGNFDVRLAWTPDEIDPSGPSIFTAVKEQLGLRLESQKDPVDVLVIDRAEHPVPHENRTERLQ
jgi:uncharacterized protein (TIGR03435 family)